MHTCARVKAQPFRQTIQNPLGFTAHQEVASHAVLLGNKTCSYLVSGRNDTSAS